MKKIHYRLGNLELRSEDNISSPLEIVQWIDESCWLIALWLRHKEGHFNLRFVRKKPFDQGVDWNDFGQLAKVGQDFIERNISD